MDENAEIEKYRESAKLHKKYSFNGEYKKANKEYFKLKKIFEKFKNGKLEKDLLVQLLADESVEVQAWAAAHLLGLNYEVKKASEILEKLEKCEDKKISLDAKMTLKVWKDKGSLKFAVKRRLVELVGHVDIVCLIQFRLFP